MKHAKERSLLAAILLGSPMVFYLLVVRPAFARIDNLVARRKQVEDTSSGPLPYVPVSSEERARLKDPSAPWRRRLPQVQGDQARLAHYHAVVSEIQRLWRDGGAPTVGLRSSWDPIRASFTFPRGLGASSEGVPSGMDLPERRVEGWVLEARFEGGPERLFRALSIAPKSTALLEPVALRWETGDDGVPKQYLAFRNLTLGP